MGEDRYYEYRIEPRRLELGGGSCLKLLQEGEEVGGGAFPLAAYCADAKPEAAAYADVLDEADMWLASRAPRP